MARFIRQAAAEPQTAHAALAEQLGLRLMLTSAVVMLAVTLCFALRYPTIVILCAAVTAATMLITTFATTLVDLLLSIHRLTTIAAVNLFGGVLLTACQSSQSAWGSGRLRFHSPILPARWRRRRRSLHRSKNASRACAVQFFRGVAIAEKVAIVHRAAVTEQRTVLRGRAALPRLIGPAGFGFFSAGTLLPTRLLIVPDGLCTAAYPHLAQRFRQSRDGGTKLTLHYLGIAVGICLPIALLVAWLAAPIARVLFPAQPEICRDVILITIWTLPLMAIESVLGYAINAADADAAQARASLPAALCNVLLTTILMCRLGITGACFSLPLRSAVRIVVLSVCFLRACMWTRADDGTISPVAACVVRES